MALGDVLRWITLPQDWQVLTPETVVLLFALLAPIVGTWDQDRRGLQQFALTGLGGAFLLTLGSLLSLEWGPFSLRYIDWSRLSLEAGHPVAEAFAVTEASQVFKLIFLGVAFLAVLAAGRPFKGKAEEDYGEFFALILFATLGMMVVASARDLIVLFLGIETASLSSYLLAGFRRDRAGSEAGLKYFVVGAVSSGFTLFAISLLYGMAGTTSIPGIAENLSLAGFDAATAVVVVFLLVGLGFKISSVPAHTWAPDVYYGAPTPVTAMLASASKAMGFVAVFQVFLVALLGIRTNWELAVALVAAVTMTVGNLVALRQNNLRRMLAYSSIAQAGYLLIAVAVGTVFALGGGVFHLMVNAAMKLGAFLVIGALLALGVPDHVDGWRGLGRRAPFLAFAMTVFLLSMAGLPPLGGFASKFVLFSSAIDVGVRDRLGWLVWLAVAAVLNSAISLYYYLRVIRKMYVEDPDAAAPDAADTAAAGTRLAVPAGVVAAVAVCLAAVVVMGVYPQWFLEAAMDAAASMMAVAP